MDKIIESTSQFIIITSNATLEVPALCPCLRHSRNNILETAVYIINANALLSIWKIRI